MTFCLEETMKVTGISNLKSGIIEEKSMEREESAS